MFANPELADLRRANFQLKPTSPAISAGTTAAYAIEDFTGIVRQLPPDIGAYEHSPGS